MLKPSLDPILPRESETLRVSWVGRAAAPGTATLLGICMNVHLRSLLPPVCVWPSYFLKYLTNQS